MHRALENINALLIDMDGVLYRGGTPIRGAARAVNRLKEMGKKPVFITNNSAFTRSTYVRKLKWMGIATKKSEIITSGHATAIYLKKKFPGVKALVVGGRGLDRELREAGLRVVDSTRADESTHVVVGLDRKLSYAKITAGLRALLNGAIFIATNGDATYPTEQGPSPGAGASIGALAGCSGTGPRITIGKPSPTILKIAMATLGTKPKETAIIGDRLDTDIAAGKRLGLRTILVLSGVSTPKDVRKARGTEIAPHFVYKTLEKVVFN